MSDAIKLESCPRPATKRDEDAYFLVLFRRSLEECTYILGMPGSPSLSDVPAELRRQLDRLRADNAALREALADALSRWEEMLGLSRHPRDRALIAEYRKLAAGESGQPATAPAPPQLAPLRHLVEQLDRIPGCGDNSCRFVRPTGMATNGGCRCHESHSARMRMGFLASLLNGVRKLAGGGDEG